jgi:hypothetical protein
MSTIAARAQTGAAPASAAPRAPTAPGGMPRTARALGGFVALFLLFDGGARTVGLAPYVEGTVQFGFAAGLAPWIGITLLAATLLYLVPRTAVLGAVLLTGYLGGAASAHVQQGDPWFLFPVVLGALAWGGLYLSDPRVRALLPLRAPAGR